MRNPKSKIVFSVLPVVKVLLYPLAARRDSLTFESENISDSVGLFLFPAGACLRLPQESTQRPKRH